MGEVDLRGRGTIVWHQVDAAKVFGSDELGGWLVGLLACGCSAGASATDSATDSAMVSASQKSIHFLAFLYFMALIIQKK